MTTASLQSRTSVRSVNNHLPTETTFFFLQISSSLFIIHKSFLFFSFFFFSISKIRPCASLQTQPIQAQPIVAAHPPHDAELEELFLARRRAPANVPLVRTDCVTKPFAARVAPAATPAAGDGDAAAVVGRRRRGRVQRHAVTVMVMVMMVVVVLASSSSSGGGGSDGVCCWARRR